ncbi:hypothetical protein [Nocardioides sp. GXQ0305]|uniref:hypothetical protein n=1 Tax=Nocardioides sp. GXQ0305 TaxID=3423912 RepID=UPI003D7E0A21
MDDELTPQETERVRRLLAEARHTDPVPDDVAARIDRTLADLAAEPAATVVPLAERRRKAGRLLLAAAAVVVGGVALGQVVGGDGSEDEAADSSAASEADEAQGLTAPDRDSTPSGDDELSTESGGSLPGAVSETRRSISRLPAQQVRSSTFAADAARLRPVATAAKVRNGATSAPEAADRLQGDGCAAGAWGGGRYVRVAFDREAGWLVYRAPRGDSQVVDLFLCDADSTERSVTLPIE